MRRPGTGVRYGALPWARACATTRSTGHYVLDKYASEIDALYAK